MRRMLAALLLALAVLAPGVALAQQGTPTFQTLTTTGNAAVGGTLQVGGAGTITGFGTAIGQALGPLANFQGSGHPALLQSDRLIFALSASAPTDFGVIQVQRSTLFTGGTQANITGALRVISTIGANDGTQEWNIIGTCSTNGKVNGLCLGGDFQGIRLAGATDAIWGGIMNAIDQTHLNTALTGATLGAEVDIRADWADDASNAAAFGTRGVRKAIQVAVHRNTLADTTPFEVSTGLWFSTGTTGSPGSDANTYYDSLIAPASGVQMRAGLDVRSAVAPTGSTDPVAAVVMSAGTVVDFNGSASLVSNPGGAYLQFRSGTGRLYYNVAGVDMWSVDGSGNVRAKGTLTGSTTP